LVGNLKRKNHLEELYTHRWMFFLKHTWERVEMHTKFGWKPEGIRPLGRATHR
jgi:hypothetical protein